MRKDDLNVHVFQYKNWCSPKSDRLFFSNFDCQRTFHRKDFKWKKNMGERGYFLKKTDVLYAELNERAETATSSYL